MLGVAPNAGDAADRLFYDMLIGRTRLCHRFNRTTPDRRAEELVGMLSLVVFAYFLGLDEHRSFVCL